MAPVESIETASKEEQEPAPLAPDFSPAPWGFWRVFLIAVGGFEGLCWVLGAIPPRAGETLALRWLRALCEHPLRSPLGLTLAYLGLTQLVRTVLNRPARA